MSAEQGIAERDRLHGADFMRAAACMMVLSIHLAQRMSPTQSLGAVEPLRVFAYTGMFGVAIFFVLSGFLLGRPFWAALDSGASMPSLKEYAIRRAVRILPGFWTALAVSFVVVIVVFGVKADTEIWLRLGVGAIGLSGWHWLTYFPVEFNAPLWSVGYELTSYVLLPMAFAILFALRQHASLSRYLWLGMIALAVLGHLIFTRLYPAVVSEEGPETGLLAAAKSYLPEFNPSGFFAMFAIGTLAAGLQVRLEQMRSWSFDVSAIGALAAGVLLLGLQAQTASTHSPGWFGIPYQFPSFALCIATFLAAAPSSRAVGRLLDNAVVRYIARISFGIYIWHCLVIELFRHYVASDLDQGQMRDPTRFAIASILTVALTILVAEISYRLIESPAMRWVRHRERVTPSKAVLSEQRATG